MTILLDMGKTTSGSSVGTGGMATKLIAARIATSSGADMVIANGNNIDNITGIMAGEDVGTLFVSEKGRILILLDYRLASGGVDGH